MLPVAGPGLLQQGFDIFAARQDHCLPCGARERFREVHEARAQSLGREHPDTLIAGVREQLAGFKCPTGVTVVPELPRNATSKVVRAALRQPFWAGRDRQVS